MVVRRGQGEGSICQLEDGSWVAVLSLGYVSGRRKRIKRRAKTKREAVKLLDEMKSVRDAGSTPDATTVKQWLTTWLDDVIEPSVKAGDLKRVTADGYRSKVDTWLIPQLGKVRIDRLGPTHIRALHAAIREAGLSEATVRNVHAVLRRALIVAQADRKIPRLPFGSVAAPSVKDRYSILTEADAGKVLHAPVNARTRARVAVAILGGLRQGEALALRWEHVTATHLLIRQSAATIGGKRVLQPPKTKASVRDVPLSPHLRDALESWREESGGVGYVFPGSGPEAIEGSERDWKIWKATLELVDVPHKPLHGARGTCATLLDKAGVPPRVIADYLGQSQVTVTMEHYLHSDDAQRRDAAQKLGGMLALDVSPDGHERR